MPTNPLQPHPQPGGWMHDLIAAVLHARGAGELDYRTGSTGPEKKDFSVLVTCWPASLSRRLRKLVVRAGQEYARWVMARQAVELERCRRQLKLSKEDCVRIAGQRDEAIAARDAAYKLLREREDGDLLLEELTRSAKETK